MDAAAAAAEEEERRADVAFTMADAGSSLWPRDVLASFGSGGGTSGGSWPGSIASVEGLLERPRRRLQQQLRSLVEREGGGEGGAPAAAAAAAALRSSWDAVVMAAWGAGQAVGAPAGLRHARDVVAQVRALTRCFVCTRTRSGPATRAAQRSAHVCRFDGRRCSTRSTRRPTLRRK